MSDRKRILFGLVFLLVALLGAALVNIVGWSAGEYRVGAIAGLVTFVVFAGLAAYHFIKVRDWAWLPAVAGGLYAVLPDLILGPADDLGAILLGAALTGFMSWRRKRTGSIDRG